MTSYQNSIPGQLRNDIEMGHQIVANDMKKQRRILQLFVSLTFLFVLAFFIGSSNENSGSMIRGNSNYGDFSSSTQPQEIALLRSQQVQSVMMASADASSGGKPPVDTEDMPQPDYNGEGRYDWQKCKESNDPDCWKNEGERVGSYWHNFGLKMKTFWMNFRKAIHDFFVGKKGEEDGDEDVNAKDNNTVSVSKKKKHKKEAIAQPAITNTTVVVP